MIDTLKDIGVIFSVLMGAIALATTIVKPIRNKLINAITRNAKVNETEKIIVELKNTIQDSLGEIKSDIKDLKDESAMNKQANKCMLENMIINRYEKFKDSDIIDAFEKDALIAHYDLCRQLGSNGKIKFRYDVLMDKNTH